MLDLFLSDQYKDDWAQIIKLAEKDDAPAREKLRRYAMEGCRISTQSFGLFRSVSKATRITEAGKTYDLKPGDEIFVNLVSPQDSNDPGSEVRMANGVGRRELGPN